MQDKDKTKEEEFPGYEESDEWQLIIDMLGDFMFIVNTNGDIIKTNPVVSKKLGYSQDELLNMNVFELYPPERSTEAEETYSQIIVGEKFLCDIPIMSKDGKLIEIETKLKLGKWREKEVIFSISRDVSADKAVEYELRVAFEKLKTIINSISDYIWSARIDKDGKFWYIFQSPVVELIAGKPSGYFQPGIDRWLSIIHEDDRERIQGIYSRLMTGEISKEEAVYKIIHPDGNIRWVRDSILSRKFGDNQIRLDGVITDITEQKIAVEALEESENRLKGILSSMSDMVFAFDRDKRFTFYHTPEMGKLYIEPDKFTGEKHADVMPSFIDKLFIDAFDKTRDGDEAEFEYWIDVGDEKKWYATKLSPIMSNGDFNGAVAVVRDITKIKLIEEK